MEAKLPAQQLAHQFHGFHGILTTEPLLQEGAHGCVSAGSQGVEQVLEDTLGVHGILRERRRGKDPKDE